MYMLYPFDAPAISQMDPSLRLSLLGSKGSVLSEMCTKLALPIPPGFILPTTLCKDYLNKEWPSELMPKIKEQISLLEKALGRVLGDPDNPLLLSIRSGAKVSMPGMMDTVLNVGLNEQTVQGLANITGNRRFAYDCYRRFLQMYAITILGADKLVEEIVRQSKQKTKQSLHQYTVFQLEILIQALQEKLKQEGYSIPSDPYLQVKTTIEAVFRSWNSKRAKVYRKRENISEDLFTAVTVQSMVFGNLDSNSGTGVVFTRNPSTGQNELLGDFLFGAQGEDIVAGTHLSDSIEEMAKKLPIVYDSLRKYCTQLEHHFRDMCDIEFTVEKGKLWILQARIGKRSALAAVNIAVDMANEESFLLSKKEAMARISRQQIEKASQQVTYQEPNLPLLTKGLAASPGVASGRVYFDPDDILEASERGESAILVREETSPADVHGMAESVGILTTCGGLVSHAAVVARSWGIPAVCGASEIQIGDRCMEINGKQIREGELISIDGGSGMVLLGSSFRERKVILQVKTLLAWAKKYQYEFSQE